MAAHLQRPKRNRPRLRLRLLVDCEYGQPVSTLALGQDDIRNPGRQVSIERRSATRSGACGSVGNPQRSCRRTTTAAVTLRLVQPCSGRGISVQAFAPRWIAAGGAESEIGCAARAPECVRV